MFRPGSSSNRPASGAASVSVAAGAKPGRLGALAVRNYQLYFVGQVISQTGSWLQRIAQSWLILQLTNSPEALGVLTVFQFLPGLVLTLFAGVVADRVPRRGLIYVTTIIETVQAFVLAWLVFSHQVQVWEVDVLSFVLGAATAFELPARQVFVNELVSRDDLQNAVALNSSVFNGARIVGPGIGGLMIQFWGTGWCFLLNGVSFIAVLVTLAMLNMATLYPMRRPRRASMLRQLGDGLRYVSRTPSLLFAVALLAVIGLFGFNFTVVLPLMARFTLNVGAAGFGYLNTAMGVGSLLGALFLATRLSLSSRTLLIAGFAFSVLLLISVLVPWYAVALVALGLLGVASVAYSTSTNTSLQLGSSEEYRGRVLSLYTLLFMGSTPIGGAITGWMAGKWSLQVAVSVEAGLCLAAVAGGWLYLRSLAREEARSNASKVGAA